MDGVAYNSALAGSSDSLVGMWIIHMLSGKRHLLLFCVPWICVGAVVVGGVRCRVFDVVARAATSAHYACQRNDIEMTRGLCDAL